MDAAFAARVGGDVDAALERGQTGGVDDRPFDTVVEPVSARVLAQLERGLEVRLQDFVVHVVGEVGGRDAPLDAGHVDEDREGRVLGADAADQAVQLCRDAEVRRVDDNLAA